MGSKKKILVFIMLLFLLLYSLSLPAYGESKKDVYLFETEGCISCEKVKEEINGLNGIDLKVFNIAKKESLRLMYDLADKSNIKISNLNKTPIAFYDNKVYIGEKEIINKLIPIIGSKESSLLPSLVAGLLNGLNPCSISIYLYIASIVMDNNGDKLKIIKYLSCYILSIYVSYFLIGYLIEKSYIRIAIIKNTFQIISGFIFLLLSVYYLRDYLVLKLGKQKQIKTQLNKKTRKLMENEVSKIIKKGSLLSSILCGFVVAILSFPCVGQIYVANLLYICSKINFSLNTLFYLIFYDFTLVLPLVIFTYLLYKGKQVFDISLKISNKLKEIKLATFIFFMLMSIYSFPVK
jgi:cytochrome c biogenesis protein CcdA